MSDFNQSRPVPARSLDRIHAEMRSNATNEHLERLLEQARADSEEQRTAAEQSQRQARHAIAAAWVGVGVAIVVGIATILITIFG